MSSIIPNGSIIASFVYEKSSNLDGYEEMDKKTIEEVQKIDGYLGHEVFGDGKKNIFLSYWKDEDSINIWKNNALHKVAKSKGKKWYKNYKVLFSVLQNDYILN
ncbi:MAG: antibiotic biosynthesis monooxygenase [Cytophagales bacterium]|nr:antibiotic biosynthesis monooxygenase [Cytophagales bacterium]